MCVMEKEKFIPISHELERFDHYLSQSDKIIFSAKFGDGKTYFLNEYFKEFTQKYFCIKLYPVNYQVEENKDIFELIKRDILIQLLATNTIEKNNVIDNELFAQYYLFNNGGDILLDILSCIPQIKTPIKIVQKAVKHIAKFQKEKEDANVTEKDKVQNYLQTFSNAKGIYEYDTYSELITRCIDKIKEVENKAVVLLIEDLDRIDPEHIFRILNILSAHIDCPYICLEESENIYNNKFNFDKIITVFHYENVEKIFHHFYGQETDFDGYIQKLTTKKPFNYSLKKLYQEYIIKSIRDNDVHENIEFFQLLLSTIIDTKTYSLRMIVNNFNDDFTEARIDKIKSIDYPFLNPFTKFIILCERFEIDCELILRTFYENKQKFEQLSDFIGANWIFVSNNLKNIIFDRTLALSWDIIRGFEKIPQVIISINYYNQTLPTQEITKKITEIKNICLEYINIDRSKVQR